MNAYLDASVFLRVLLNQALQLESFSKIEKFVASKLFKTEVLRTLDRHRLNGFLSEDEYIKAVEETYKAFEFIEFVEIADTVLDRASQSISVGLGTLDAIHLISALYWKEIRNTKIVFATHDERLAKAAIACGFEVMGC